MKVVPISVDYVDHMGTDLDIVNAARVSFDKESEWENQELSSTEEVDFTKRFQKPPTLSLKEKDQKLIHYLASHNHWSPFGHCTAKFRIKAPIFVARQLVKHQIGLVWNEVSRRYVDSEPEFYFPKTWRGKPVNKKQGSSEEILTEIPGATGLPVPIDGSVKWAVQHTVFLYQGMIDAGVAPEQARMILPQNMMTQWIWTGSLYAFTRICNLRMKEDAQEETQIVAHEINRYMLDLFPVSWKALVPNWFKYGPKERKKVDKNIEITLQNGILSEIKIHHPYPKIEQSNILTIGV